MTAKTGVPVRTVANFEPGGAEWEVHEPVEGTLLAVCGACGFTFDAGHETDHPDGRKGYECAWCLFHAIVKAREEVIKRSVREHGQTLARTMRVETTRLRAVALAGIGVVKAVLAPASKDRLESSAALGTNVQLLRRALEHAGFDLANGQEVQRTPTPGAIAQAVAAARGEFDAETKLGALVYTLCDELDRLLGVDHDA